MILAEVFHLRIKFNKTKNYELRIRTLNQLKAMHLYNGT